jgi:hypothetical protein
MSGYGVPGSDYSQAMQAQQGPSYGKTELRDIGNGMQQYYALNMASGEWEPIGQPMPKTGASGQISGNSVTVTTPNGTDVTFGPNQIVTKQSHVDTQPAQSISSSLQEDTDFTAFQISHVIGGKNVPAGENGRAYGGQDPVSGKSWVLGPNTPVVYEPGNYNYDAALSPTGKSLASKGGYDSKRGVFVVATPERSGEIP